MSETNIESEPGYAESCARGSRCRPLTLFLIVFAIIIFLELTK